MGQRGDDLRPSLAQLHLHRLRTAPRIGPEWGWARGGTQHRGRALSLDDERLDRGAAGADHGDTMITPGYWRDVDGPADVMVTGPADVSPDEWRTVEGRIGTTGAPPVWVVEAGE